MYIISQTKMNIRLLPKFIFITIITLGIFYFSGLLFAQEETNSSLDKESMGDLSVQARQYRQEGLEKQRMGNLPEAMSLYQKAIAMDPGYAVAYNDLGVIYEAAGFPDRAKDSYFRAIKVDPGYLSAYTNIALLYEEQRDLERAAFYWAKRAELGSFDDPWTQKAANRFKDIRAVLSNRPVADALEDDVLGLIKDISVYKSAFSKVDQKQARHHLRKANQYYRKMKLTAALKEALDAQFLDQNNPDVKEFIERIDLEPGSPAAYNDLGVIYEAAGFPERAEDSYLKSLKLDPTLLSAYVNVALLYEKQRNLEKAEFYWSKRAELGADDDPWKLKAANRVRDIRAVLSSSPVTDTQEAEVLGLMKDVSDYRTSLANDDKALAQDHFNKARQSFDKGDLAAAIKEALDAQVFDQDNQEIEAFIEKAELRALSR